MFTFFKRFRDDTLPRKSQSPNDKSGKTKNVSYNFIEFWPPAINDLIFQHLSGTEVLSTSYVHRSWNQFQSTQSLACWRNIFLHPMTTDDLKILANSKRRYQHIKVENIPSVATELIATVCSHNRKWKSLVLEGIEFENESQAVTMLQFSNESIESLSLRYLTCKITFDDDDDTQPINFPRLKFLRIHEFMMSSSWMNKIFSSCPQLEHLELEDACDEQMTKIILSSVSLKKMSITGSFESKTFFTDLALKLQSSLEELIFYPSEILDDFCLFLESQSETLIFIYTDVSLETYEFETVLRMKNLKNLSVDVLSYDQDHIDEYLERRRLSVLAESNLTFLKITLIDQNTLEFLAIHASNLQNISVGRLAASDASNWSWFPMLQKLQAMSVNHQLIETIEAKPSSRRSRLENFIVS